MTGAGRDNGTPTIMDVARRAGVSKSLVSLVLRDSPQVSDGRREAVREAISELGYRPNAMARGLVQQRTGVIGVLLADLHNDFFADVIDGIQEEAAAHGHRALMATPSPRSAAAEEVLEGLLEQRMDALILVSLDLPVRLLRKAVAAVPTVIVGECRAPVDGLDVVDNDDRVGTAAAIDHLVRHGHRRITYISGSQSADDARTRGYRQAMATHGLGPQTEVVRVAGTVEEGGHQGARRLLTRPEPPTAILGANDLIALGVLEESRALGLAVPRDLSVVGYDDTHLASLGAIGLTSVNQPRYAMGRRACALVHARLDRRDTGSVRAVLEPSLTVRTSVGPPRG